MTFLEALRFMEDHPGREVLNSDDEAWRFNRTLQAFERRNTVGVWVATDVSLKNAARLHALDWRTSPANAAELAGEWRALADRMRRERAHDAIVSFGTYASAFDACADELLELDKRVRT